MNNLEQSVPKLAVPPMELNLSTHLREVICECVSNNCTESFGLTTSAIVLTGSMARDEATFIRKEEMWQLVGDAEFMVVFENRKVFLPPRLSMWFVKESRTRLKTAG